MKYGISKHGVLSPVIHIDPVRCDGATIRKITGNNAKFILDMGIGVGAKLTVKRSGMVIPMVVNVIQKVVFVYPEIGVPIVWNENGIQLLATEITPEQEIKGLISFFKILAVDNVGDGICDQLYNAGYKTIKQILSMSKGDMIKLDRFGDKKADKVYKSIHTKMCNVLIHKLQHATGLFAPLGSKKLKLVIGMENATVEELVAVEGFSDISAEAYLEGVKKFKPYMEDMGDLIGVKMEEEKPEISGISLDGFVFVFSGGKRADLNSIIISNGGVVVSGMNNKVTHLVMKVKGTGSNKETSALARGKIIMTVGELEDMLSKL